MPFYESVLIARQDVSAQQVESLSENLQEIVRNNGGTVAKTEYWGLRNLAFRIKKNRKGHYLLMHLDGPPEAVQEFERNARINEDVLRYLTVRVDALEEGPTVMMQTRTAREGSRRERGGRDRDRGERGGDDRPRDDRPRDDRPRDDRPSRDSRGGGEED